MPRQKDVKVLFRGLHADRYGREPKELVAALLWQKQHEGCLAPGTLPHLLGDGRDPVRPSSRDYEVAATVIQWLGSSIGQAFLREFRDECEKIDDQERKRR